MTTENDLAVNFTDKLILDMEDPDVVNPAIKESYEDLPALQHCEAITNNGNIISTVPYTAEFVQQHNVNPSALRYITTFVSDGVYIINPAWFDPVKSTEALFGQSPNKMISLPGKPMQVSHAICMLLGYIFTCNVVYPTMFGKQQAQMVKSILFGPMHAE
ncbi:hypothetical protein C8Q73DRAFT_792606 [Cubamyces lactineus]|nr:hypothetical protein C8Q73DRAFT_792606 [Cubamyces lactineus]